MELIKRFKGVDFELQVFDCGFVLRLLSTDPEKVGCESVISEFEHWEDDEEIEAMDKAGFFGGGK